MRQTNPSPPGVNVEKMAFAWCDKAVLRRIREAVPDYSSAIGVYVALCCVASDNASESFTTTHSWLAQMSGLGVRTVQRRLADLERLGAVEVKTPAMRAPCSYRLLSPSGDTRTFGHSGATFGHSGATFGHGRGRSVAGIRSTTTTKCRKTKQPEEVTESWLAELQADAAYRQLSVALELAKARRWCEANKRQCTRRFFVNWLNRCRQSPPGSTRNNGRPDPALLARISDLRAQLAREFDPTKGEMMLAELRTLEAQLTGGVQR